MTGTVTKSSFVVNSSVRLNGNYGTPVSSYPEFDGDANYKITAVGTANHLVTLVYVDLVDDCSDWPTNDPPGPPQLYYRLIGCPKYSGNTPQDCYYLSELQPNAEQRFVDGASGGSSGTNYDFYKYSGDQGLTYNGGVLCTNIQPVGLSTGCPPTDPPVPPQPPQPPTPTSQRVTIRECYQSSGTEYNVQITNGAGFTEGLAVTLSGSPDDSKYWQIIVVDVASSTMDVTTTAIQSSCGGFTPPPVPPVPPTPTTVYAQYLECDGLDNVAYVSGPSGTTFPGSLKISGICYAYSTLGGSSGADYTNYDSFGNCAECEADTPTPPTPPPSPPTPTCFAINNIGVDISSAQNACNTARRETHYFNNSSLCQATVYYGTNSSCSSAYGASLYIADGSYSRYWSGSSFNSCEICQQQ